LSNTPTNQENWKPKAPLIMILLALALQVEPTNKIVSIYFCTAQGANVSTTSTDLTGSLPNAILNET